MDTAPPAQPSWPTPVWPPPTVPELLPGREWRATIPPPPPPGAERRSRRGLIVGLVVTLVASAAGVAGWRGLGPSGPDHPSAWDPRVTDLVSFVEQERRLTFEHPVHVDFLPDAEFRSEIMSDDDELSADDREDVEQAAGMFRALGLIGSDVDLLTAVNGFQGEAALAFYDPETDRIRVRGTELNVKVRATLVHELTHALQDQHFDLSREGDFDVDAQNDTFRPLFEGDATRVEQEWVKKLGDADLAAYQRAAEAESTSINLDGIPDSVVQFFTAPYNFGYPFVEVLVSAIGRQAVDKALQDPPRSEAELLDPFRHLDGERPIPVAEPALGPGEEKIDDGAFGAIALYLVLAQHLDPARALAATDAWGGDAYVNYRRDGKSCVRANFTGKDSGATTVLAGILGAWASGLPSQAATVSRQGDLVTLHSCDPGNAAASAPTGDMNLAVGLAVTRTQMALTMMDSGLSANRARCTAHHFLAAFSPRELPGVLLAQTPDEILAADAARAGEAARRACLGRG